jgi:hypothetical protein
MKVIENSGSFARCYSLAPRGERVRVRDICAARLTGAPHIPESWRIWSLTRHSKTSVGLSPLGERQLPPMRIKVGF